MKVIRADEVAAKDVAADSEGNPAKSTSIRVLTPEAPNFVMRLFAVGPGGHTPLHEHPWEHEVFVVEGRGRTVGKLETEFSAGDALYVPPGEMHSFENTGSGELRLICVVPRSAG